MNWGGFAGGFATGFNNGVAMGKTISAAMKEKKLEDIRAQGIAEAAAARDKAVANSVSENGGENATPATAPTGAQPQPALNATPQASPAPAAPNAYPAAEDPMTADRPVGSMPTSNELLPRRQQQPAPIDPALTAAPQPRPQEPALTSTPQASPMPAVPVEAPASPATQGIATAPKRFSVNGQGFDTREEALAHAKKNAPSLMDFMSKTLVPKMQEAYLAQGDMEKAEAWGKWAKEKDNERHMKSWADAFKSYQQGDFVTSAKHLVSLHKDLPDGNTIVAAEPVKDKSGTVTGFNMKLKNDQTGEVRSQFVDPKALTEYGLAALSPDKMFSAVFQRQSAADALAAKARIDAQNDQRTYNREIDKQKYIEDRADKRDTARDRREASRDDRRHGYKLEELVTGEQLKQSGIAGQERAKLQTRIDLARENGATEDEIKAMVPHLLGGAGYKKTTDPTERRAIVIDTLMKNDTTFSRAKPEEQEAKVGRMMKLTYGEDPKPAAQPQPTAAPPGLKDGVYKDSKTGEVFRVQGGKRAPVK